MRCHIKVAGILIFILISEREDFLSKKKESTCRAFRQVDSNLVDEISLADIYSMCYFTTYFLPLTM